MKRLWALVAVAVCCTLEVLAQNPNTAIFTGAPGVAATDSDLLVATNSAQSTLNGAITSGATTVTLTSAASFTTPMAIKIDSEILKCTSKSGNTLTCPVRGFDGTAAASHSDGTAVFGYLFDWHHNQLAAEVKAIEAVVPGKAPLASPVFTGTVDSSGAAHTLPAVKGTNAAKPATCTVGEEYFATDATAGQNKYYCTAPNTWTQQSGGSGAVSSVFGRTGAVVAVSGDYNVAQVTGAAPTASPTFTGTVALPATVTLAGAALNAANGLVKLNGSAVVPPTNLVFTMPVFAEFSSICQAGTAVIGFSLPSSNAPTANCVTGTNTNLGVATFTATGQTVQGRLLLPNDWTSTVDLDVRFRSVGTSGNVVWNIATACVANTGATVDPAFNAANTGSVAARGTTLQDNQATMTSITTTGCSAGNLLMFKFGLDSSTTTTGNEDLFSIRFTIRRMITAS